MQTKKKRRKVETKKNKAFFQIHKIDDGALNKKIFKSKQTAQKKKKKELLSQKKKKMTRRKKKRRRRWNHAHRFSNPGAADGDLERRSKKRKKEKKKKKKRRKEKREEKEKEKRLAPVGFEPTPLARLEP